MKHTKGEWITRKSSDESGIDVGVKQKNGSFCPIANVTWYGEEDCNAEEDEANAKLIAAAPKLLAACQRLRRRAETGNAITQGDVGILETAIAEAT